MQQRASLSHTKWDCKYHIVFVPKHPSDVTTHLAVQDFPPVFRHKHDVILAIPFGMGQ